MAERTVTVDLIVDSVERDDVQTVESQLRSFGFGRTPTTRDLQTILTLTGSSIGVANALLALWSSLRRKPSSAGVTVEVESGATLELNTATEDEIHSLLAQS
jgi:hypothetical protein